MVQDSNNNIGCISVLPFETCQHLFKRCSLLRNMKFTFSCLTFIKRMRYVTADNKLHNGTRFAKKYRALQLKR